MNYDGTYRGITSQAREIGFRVSGNAIARFWFGINLDDPAACTAALRAAGVFTGSGTITGHACGESDPCGLPERPIPLRQDGSFEFTDTWTSADGSTTLFRRGSGRFNGAGGELHSERVGFPVCSGSVTWSITSFER